MNDTEVLATGPEFVRQGVRGIEPVIQEILMQASEEIQITAYVFTLKALHIFDLIQQAADKGVKVVLVVNNLDSQIPAIRDRMKMLSQRYGHVQIKDFKQADQRQQLHAKVIVVDRKVAVVGSANFSWSGMHGNYEIGLLVKGDNAWQLAKVIDVLSSMS